MNIAAALKEATSLLKDNTPRARFEAELLLAYHLGVDRVYLAQRDDEEVDDIEGNGDKWEEDIDAQCKFL